MQYQKPQWGLRSNIPQPTLLREGHFYLKNTCLSANWYVSLLKKKKKKSSHV